MTTTLHQYEITYTDSKVVVHETVIAASVPAAIEEFNTLVISGYVDILGIIESELPELLRGQAL